MSATLVWALLNGLITGGVWVGIVILRRQQRFSQHQADLLEDLRRHLDSQEDLTRRLAEVEERLDFAERMLSRERSAERLPPPR